MSFLSLKIHKILVKAVYEIQNSQFYDFLKNPENSKSYVTKNAKSLGNNFNIPDRFIIKNPQYITIGDNFFSLYNLRLEAWDNYMGGNFNPQIIIGNNVSLNSDVHIGCINEIVIGDNVMIASKVYISDHSHGDITIEDLIIPAGQRELKSKGPVIIEKNVWIGEGVCVLPGVTIGENSIVGANAVVTKNFPKNSIIGGVPAKLIKQL